MLVAYSAFLPKTAITVALIAPICALLGRFLSLYLHDYSISEGKFLHSVHISIGFVC
jgi:hypothetical protein